MILVRYLRIHIERNNVEMVSEIILDQEIAFGLYMLSMLSLVSKDENSFLLKKKIR